MKNIILGSLVFFFIILLLWYFVYFQLFYIETKFKTNFETNLETNMEGLVGIFGSLTMVNIKDIQKILKDSSDTDVIVSQLQSLELSGNIGTIINDEQNDSYKILQLFLVEFNSQVDLLYGNNLLIYYPFDKVSNVSRSNDKVSNESSSNKNKYDGTVLPWTVSVKIDFKTPPGMRKASIDFVANSMAIQIPPMNFENSGKFSGFTTAFWFKITKTHGCFYDFSNRGGNRGDYHNLVCMYSNYQITLGFANTPNEGHDVSITIDKNDTKIWNHLVSTISDTGNLKLYMNGKLMREKQAPYAPLTVERTQNLIQRSSNIFGDLQSTGGLADFRVYDIEWKEDMVKNYYDYANFKLTLNTSNYILNFHLDCKDNNSITNDNTGLLVWKDVVWRGTTNGIASDTSVVYNTTSQKVTVPAGSYIDIPTNNNKFGGPFTIYIVANLYDFNPTKIKGKETNIAYNHLFGSSEYNAFEVFCFQNQFCLDLVGKNERIAVAVPSMPPIDPKIPHIFTITCDAKGILSFYIDSRSIIRKKKFTNNQIPGNYPIRLGCALGKDEYPSSNDIDYYQILHFRNYHNGFSRNMYEGLCAEKWSLRAQLDDSNIFKNLPIR